MADDDLLARYRTADIFFEEADEAKLRKLHLKDLPSG